MKVKTLHWMKYGDCRYENICLEIACNAVNKMYCHLASCSCIANILGGGAMDKH